MSEILEALLLEAVFDEDERNEIIKEMEALLDWTAEYNANPS
jgi:hypothetical protein